MGSACPRRYWALAVIIVENTVLLLLLLTVWLVERDHFVYLQSLNVCPCINPKPTQQKKYEKSNDCIQNIIAVGAQQDRKAP